MTEEPGRASVERPPSPAPTSPEEGPVLRRPPSTAGLQPRAVSAEKPASAGRPVAPRTVEVTLSFFLTARKCLNG